MGDWDWGYGGGDCECHDDRGGLSASLRYASFERHRFQAWHIGDCGVKIMRR